GESGGGIYHSIYDDFYWYTTFGDHDFAYGKALSQTGGTATMRMADSELLPFDFINLAETVRKYSDELKRLLKTTQEEVRERNRQIGEGVFTATDDPRRPLIPPSVEEVPPHLNFAPLDNAIDMLAQSADRYDKAAKNIRQDKLSASDLKAVNAKLIQSERKLTHPDGLPGRPWFKHLIYAPGFYTGYGVKTIPGVREAIEQKKWEEADREIVRVSNVLREKAALVSSAAALLEGSKN
ncbi:MAG: transferrin receptor-like dimerization domain-containing protein, partial [Bacteroidota bacterium]